MRSYPNCCGPAWRLNSIVRFKFKVTRNLHWRPCPELLRKSGLSPTTKKVASQHYVLTLVPVSAGYLWRQRKVLRTIMFCLWLFCLWSRLILSEVKVQQLPDNVQYDFEPCKCTAAFRFTFKVVQILNSRPCPESLRRSRLPPTTEESASHHYALALAVSSMIQAHTFWS